MTVKQWIVGLVALAGSAVGVYLLGSALVTWYAGLPSDTRIALTGAVGVLLVPVITFFTTRTLERRRSRDDAIREQRTALYDKVIRGLMRMLNLAKQDTKMTSDEMAQLFADITPDLLIYGSRGVLQSWNNFRQVARLQAGDSKAVMLAFEGMLGEMRKDLGHRVASASSLELTAVFVNDIENLAPRKVGRGRRA